MTVKQDFLPFLPDTVILRSVLGPQDLCSCVQRPFGSTLRVTGTSLGRASVMAQTSFAAPLDLWYTGASSLEGWAKICYDAGLFSLSCWC